LSAFLLQIHCIEIADICSQIADDVCDKVCPRIECKKAQQWEIAGEAPWGVARVEVSLSSAALGHPSFGGALRQTSRTPRGDTFYAASAPIHSVRDLSAA
jgi:hypothetical protein